MIVNERLSTRIVMTDIDEKTLCSFSGINPVATANEVAAFASAVNGLRTQRAEFTYVIRENKLIEV